MSIIGEVPTSVQVVIPAYVYEQYADDENVSAFFQAFNIIAQRYLNWFNQVALAIYTNTNIEDALLDWIGQGIYGYARPVLPMGGARNIGPFNTWTLNSLQFNGGRRVGPTTLFITTDDIYRRCLTWHFYKGDGKVFSIRWLKRRVNRFLTGINGADVPNDTTYQIGVQIVGSAQATINITTGGAISVMNAQIFQSGIASGALETPFQFEFVVTINGVAPSGFVFGVSGFGTGGF